MLSFREFNKEKIESMAVFCVSEGKVSIQFDLTCDRRLFQATQAQPDVLAVVSEV